jgi:hypothetical protein
LRRIPPFGIGQPDVRDRLSRSAKTLRLAHASQFQWQRDVSQHVSPRQQVRVLKDVGNRSPVNQSDLAPIGSIQASDHAKQRRFPAAAGTKDRDELAGGHVEIDVIDCDDVAIEHAAHAAKLKGDARR